MSRLLEVLELLDAIFRIQPSRGLRPNLSHLSGSGHINLQTRYGPLDVLTNIGDNLRYADLPNLSTPLLIDESSTIRVLGLKTLIQVKEQLGGEKDLAMLPVLGRTLIESENLSR